MLTNDEPDGYQTYLLRLWRARCKGKWQWRASIESPHTGEHQWFAGLEQLLEFLEAKAPGAFEYDGGNDEFTSPAQDGRTGMHEPDTPKERMT